MYVYKFGLSAPVDEASRTLVYDQIRGAHRYRNTLVEIERGLGPRSARAAGERFDPFWVETRCSGLGFHERHRASRRSIRSGSRPGRTPGPDFATSAAGRGERSIRSGSRLQRAVARELPVVVSRREIDPFWVETSW